MSSSVIGIQPPAPSGEDPDGVRRRFRPPGFGTHRLAVLWRIPLTTLVALILACVVLPIGVTLAMSVLSGTFGSGASLTFDNYRQALTDANALPLLRNTVILTVCSAVLATMMGLVLAWIVTSTDVPFVRVLYWLPVTPILLPVLMKDTGWIMLYSPRTGLVNIWLQDLLGLSQPLFDIYSMTGMIIILAMGITPVVYLILVPAMSSLSRSLEEASRVTGAGWATTLWRVVLPAVRPAILSSAALAALLVATAFETPILVGLPGGVRTYISAIYNSMSGQSIPDYNLASAQSAVYLLISAVLLTAYLRATRSEQRFAVVGGRGYSQGVRTRVGAWRWVLALVVIGYFLVGFVQLLLASSAVSLVPYYTVTDGNPLRTLTLDGYRAELNSSLWAAVSSSLVLASAVAVLTTGAALLLSFVAFKTRLRLRRAVEAIATVPVALPPVVFSVSLLITVLFVPGLVVAYGTDVPLVIASVIVFLPFAMRIIASATIQVGDELLEASRVSGARWLRSMVTVMVPLLGVAITNAAIFVFVQSFRELGAVVLLISPSQILLPVKIFSSWEEGEVTSVAVLNVLSAVIPLAVLVVVFSARRLFGAARRARARAASTVDHVQTEVRGA
ncbi:ABC transporter permease [Phytohabitans suffuscus]